MPLRVPRVPCLLALLAAALVLPSGCGTGSSSPASSGTGDLRIDLAFQQPTSAPSSDVQSVPDIPSGVVNISATVSSATGSNPPAQTVPVAQGYVRFDGLVAADDYTVALQALDSSSSALCNGSASNVSVQTGAVADIPVSLTCSSTASGGQIGAQWAAALTVNGAGVTDSVSQLSDDWYNFSVQTAGSVTVTVTPTAGNPDLYVFSSANAFNSDGSFNRNNLVGSSAGPGGDSVQFSAVAQQYHVMVYGQSAADYTITVTSP